MKEEGTQTDRVPPHKGTREKRRAREGQTADMCAAVPYPGDATHCRRGRGQPQTGRRGYRAKRSCVMR
ncbi:hypothetical protein DDE01_23370 [Desulfovibrio desulfuricans]|nr:hypothetical protein DDE01_23370 [Desulfovibrio desulfuricans]